jgi:hypothetical protein
VDVVAHQVELVPPARLVGVDADLGRRQRKDLPALAGVDAAVAQRLPEEAADRLRVLRVEQHVRADDHGHLPDARLYRIRG